MYCNGSIFNETDFTMLIKKNYRGKILKVSKAQKHFFLETPLPKKRTKYLTKCCPSFIGHTFV